jgi:hypothetical protein
MAKNMGKIKSRDVILILARMPNKIPAIQKNLPKNLVSIQTRKSKKKEIIGISVAGK